MVVLKNKNTFAMFAKPIDKNFFITNGEKQANI